MQKSVVFIIGIGRSGSTLMDLMLGSHPRAFSLGEISKLPDFVKRGKRLCVLEDSYFWQEQFTETERQNLARGMSGHRLHRHIPLKLERWVRGWLGNDAILNPYSRLFEKIDADVLVDSSKYFSWLNQRLAAREFRQQWLQPFLIHMVRDGRAVVNSYLRIYPDKGIEGLTQHWLNELDQKNKIYDRYPSDRKMMVHYEALASDPEGTLKQVCDAVGLEFRPDMIEFWKHPHHHVVGSSGINSMIAKYRGLKAQQPLETIHGDYYNKIDFEIKLDLRWQKELSPENLAVFERMAGERNRPFTWPRDSQTTPSAVNP
ncbi:sulfotransferase [Phormidium yuhuli AB48]|uniref:Sulfotransferase n=1 Tax=Phormidium yuhuli AB48 TaxID=2940671 RepID=A0ABY5AQ21_9CYAN|nr:sulfotransferase [Phormidium yuhuli]USR91100.1 sulfotransferase [Phormidium yuhuli AB48]